MFKIIACINKKRVIGKDGGLLYHVSNDLKNFSRMTKYNGVVIMGRKTFESLPNGRPLPGRVNIIITSNTEYGIEPADNVYITNSIEDAIELCETMFSDKELFVIGGESIYKQFLDMGIVSEMRLTIVDGQEDGDAFFPEYSMDDWEIYYDSMPQTSVWENKRTEFHFQVLKKKK